MRCARPISWWSVASPKPGSQLVGAERFEPTNTLAQVTYAQAIKEPYIMLHASKSLPSVEDLKRELEQADIRRRQVLVSLFGSYEGEVAPLIELLMRDARSATLYAIEQLLTTGSEG